MSNQSRGLTLVKPLRFDPKSPPPHDAPRERALLACMIADERVVDLVVDIVTRDDFYDERRGILFEALTTIRHTGGRIGVVSVVSWLQDRGWLEQLGGEVAIAQLATNTPNIGHAVDHAKRIAWKSQRRKLIAECQAIEAESFGDVGDEQEFLENCSVRVRKFCERMTTTSSTSIRTAVEAAYQEIHLIAARRGAILGYPTGLSSLDKLTGGLQGGDVTLVGGETGRGKSSFAACVAMNLAKSPQIEVVRVNGDTVDVVVPIGVAIFTLEMDAKEWGMRVSCAHGRVNYQQLRAGDWEQADLQRLASSAEFVSGLPIELDDDVDLTISRITAKLARIEAKLAEQGIRLGLVILDYIQLANAAAEAPKNSSREQQLSEFGRQIKNLASRFRARPRALPIINGVAVDCGYLEPSKVAWFVLTQLNEDGHARESKALEQHSQNILILEHDPDAMPDGPGKTTPGKIRIKKQRSGPRNVVATCWWHEAYTLYSDEDR